MAIAAGTSALSACSSDANVFNPTFYATPDPIPSGSPGTIVRRATMTAPTDESQAWRVIYTSTGIDGEPIVVSGMIFAPTGDAPAGGRPVVSWAHPTTGITDGCAPSRSGNPYGGVRGLTQFLDMGWVVVASDYQGLGTEGPHPYLVGESEAHGVIDIVRAARNIPEIGASTQFLAYGHSQGGQAALFAGQIASRYAPELQLDAVAAAAPAGLLTELFQDDQNTAAGAVLGSYAVVSWSEVFGYDETTVIESQFIDRVRATSDKCVVGGSRLSTAELAVDDLILKGRLWAASPATTPPWAQQFAINTAAQEPIPAPVLMVQGTKDQIVIPATTSQLVADYKANGTTISETILDGADHAAAGPDSVPYVVEFFSSVAAR